MAAETILSINCKELGVNKNAVPQQTTISDPSACAATTATAIDPSAMDDGSADNVLDVVGDTSTGNQSGPIELNFDKIADEVNALKADVDAHKTAIDANNAAIDTLIDRLQAFGFIA